MPSNAIVTFHGEDFPTRHLLLKNFSQMTQDVPDFEFFEAEVNTLNYYENKVCLTLKAKNGFIVLVTGLKPGTEKANLLLDLIAFTGFTLDPETYFGILNTEKVRIKLVRVV